MCIRDRGIIPLIVAPIAVTGAYVAKVAEAAQESLVKAGGIATEAVLHMRTVRAYGIEAAVSRKFDDFLELPERQAIRKGLAGGLGAGVAAATILLGASFQYYVGGIFFRKGWVSFSDLMTVLLVIICVEIKFYGTFVNLHAIDAPPARCAPDALVDFHTGDHFHGVWHWGRRGR